MMHYSFVAILVLAVGLVGTTNGFQIVSSITTLVIDAATGRPENRQTVQVLCEPVDFGLTQQFLVLGSDGANKTVSVTCNAPTYRFRAVPVAQVYQKGTMRQFVFVETEAPSIAAAEFVLDAVLSVRTNNGTLPSIPSTLSVESATIPPEGEGHYERSFHHSHHFHGPETTYRDRREMLTHKHVVVKTTPRVRSMRHPVKHSHRVAKRGEIELHGLPGSIPGYNAARGMVCSNTGFGCGGGGGGNNAEAMEAIEDLKAEIDDLLKDVNGLKNKSELIGILQEQLNNAELAFLGNITELGGQLTEASKRINDNTAVLTDLALNFTTTTASIQLNVEANRRAAEERSIATELKLNNTLLYLSNFTAGLVDLTTQTQDALNAMYNQTVTNDEGIRDELVLVLRRIENMALFNKDRIRTITSAVTYVTDLIREERFDTTGRRAMNSLVRDMIDTEMPAEVTPEVPFLRDLGLAPPTGDLAKDRSTTSPGTIVFKWVGGTVALPVLKVDTYRFMCNTERIVGKPLVWASLYEFSTELDQPPCEVNPYAVGGLTCKRCWIELEEDSCTPVNTNTINGTDGLPKGGAGWWASPFMGFDNVGGRIVDTLTPDLCQAGTISLQAAGTFTTILTTNALVTKLYPMLCAGNTLDSYMHPNNGIKYGVYAPFHNLYARVPAAPTNVVDWCVESILLDDVQNRRDSVLEASLIVEFSPFSVMFAFLGQIGATATNNKLATERLIRGVLPSGLTSKVNNAEVTNHHNSRVLTYEFVSVLEGTMETVYDMNPISFNAIVDSSVSGVNGTSTTRAVTSSTPLNFILGPLTKSVGDPADQFTIFDVPPGTISFSSNPYQRVYTPLYMAFGMNETDFSYQRWEELNRGVQFDADHGSVFANTFEAVLDVDGKCQTTVGTEAWCDVREQFAISRVGGGSAAFNDTFDILLTARQSSQISFTATLDVPLGRVAMRVLSECPTIGLSENGNGYERSVIMTNPSFYSIVVDLTEITSTTCTGPPNRTAATEQIIIPPEGQVVKRIPACVDSSGLSIPVKVNVTLAEGPDAGTVCSEQLDLGFNGSYAVDGDSLYDTADRGWVRSQIVTQQSTQMRRIAQIIDNLFAAQGLMMNTTISTLSDSQFINIENMRTEFNATLVLSQSIREQLDAVIDPDYEAIAKGIWSDKYGDEYNQTIQNIITERDQILSTIDGLRTSITTVSDILANSTEIVGILNETAIVIRDLKAKVLTAERSFREGVISSLERLVRQQAAMVQLFGQCIGQGGQAGGLISGGIDFVSGFFKRAPKRIPYHTLEDEGARAHVAMLLKEDTRFAGEFPDPSGGFVNANIFDVAMNGGTKGELKSGCLDVILGNGTTATLYDPEVVTPIEAFTAMTKQVNLFDMINHDCTAFSSEYPQAEPCTTGIGIADLTRYLENGTSNDFQSLFDKDNPCNIDCGSSNDFFGALFSGAGLDIGDLGDLLPIDAADIFNGLVNGAGAAGRAIGGAAGRTFEYIEDRVDDAIDTAMELKDEFMGIPGGFMDGLKNVATMLVYILLLVGGVFIAFKLFKRKQAKDAARDAQQQQYVHRHQHSAYRHRDDSVSAGSDDELLRGSDDDGGSDAASSPRRSDAASSV